MPLSLLGSRGCHPALATRLHVSTPRWPTWAGPSQGFCSASGLVCRGRWPRLPGGSVIVLEGRGGARAPVRHPDTCLSPWGSVQPLWCMLWTRSDPSNQHLCAPRGPWGPRLDPWPSALAVQCVTLPVLSFKLLGSVWCRPLLCGCWCGQGPHCPSVPSLELCPCMSATLGVSHPKVCFFPRKSQC